MSVNNSIMHFNINKHFMHFDEENLRQNWKNGWLSAKDAKEWWGSYRVYQLLLEITLIFLSLNIQTVIVKSKANSSEHLEQNGKIFYNFYAPEDT